jgi:hypothetical protein
VGYYPRDKRALESKLIVGREEGIGKRIETSGERQAEPGRSGEWGARSEGEIAGVK